MTKQNEIWDLDAMTDTRKAKEYCKQHGYDQNTHPRFKVGQEVSFMTGYYDHIKAKAKIKGFDDNGKIYIYADAYWFPIKDNDIKQVKILTL